MGQISVGKTEERPLNFDDLYTMTVDDLHPLQEIVKEMAGNNELLATKDPYKLARLMRGWHGKPSAFINNSPYRFKTYENVGKPLKKILLPVTERAVRKYLKKFGKLGLIKHEGDVRWREYFAV